MDLPATGPAALKPKMPRIGGARTGIKTMPATAPPMAPMARRVLAGAMKALGIESFEWAIG